MGQVSIVVIKHTCPACNTPVHATCGEVDEAAPIQWSTTCYPCYGKYGRTFSKPDDFTAHYSNVVASSFLPPEGALQSNLAASLSPEGALSLAERKRKRKDQVRTWTLEKCDILESSLTPVRLNKNAGETRLRSIGGVGINDLSCDDLKYFCAANKISNYKSKTKLAIANMVVTHIVNHNCYDNMAGKSDIDKTPGDKSTKNKVKKGVNATIPQVVSMTGTYFRAINVYFGQSTRPLVISLGSQPTANELDQGCSKFLHEPVYEILCKEYNAEDEVLDKLQYNHRIFDNEKPSQFDHLTTLDLANVLEYIKAQYKKMKNSLSGDHVHFENKVGEKVWLLYMHMAYNDNGEIAALVIPSLNSAFGETMDRDDGEDDDGQNKLVRKKKSPARSTSKSHKIDTTLEDICQVCNCVLANRLARLVLTLSSFH